MTPGELLYNWDVSRHASRRYAVSLYCHPQHSRRNCANYLSVRINLQHMAAGCMQVEAVRLFKYDVGVSQLLSVGSEGYRARGQFDPSADISYPFNNWLNDGMALASAQSKDIC